MSSKAVRNGKKTKGCGKKEESKSKTTSYRLKCGKTANGLSHYVMYGDAEGKSSLL